MPRRLPGGNLQESVYRLECTSPRPGAFRTHTGCTSLRRGAFPSHLECTSFRRGGYSVELTFRHSKMGHALPDLRHLPPSPPSSPLSPNAGPSQTRSPKPHNLKTPPTSLNGGMPTLRLDLAPKPLDPSVSHSCPSCQRLTAKQETVFSSPSPSVYICICARPSAGLFLWIQPNRAVACCGVVAK